MAVKKTVKNKQKIVKKPVKKIAAKPIKKLVKKVAASKNKKPLKPIKKIVKSKIKAPAKVVKKLVAPKTKAIKKPVKIVAKTKAKIVKKTTPKIIKKPLAKPIKKIEKKSAKPEKKLPKVKVKKEKIKKEKVKKEPKPRKPKKVKTPINDRTNALAERFQLIQGVKSALQRKDDDGKKLSSDLADKLKKLLALGKSQGFLTHDQINENIDTDIDPRKLDRIIDILTEFKIQIVEKEDDLDKFLEDGQAAKDEEKSQKRSEDSVKTYLKSMSTVKLLTREDEVSIAMRIEEGRNKTVKSLYNSPIIMRHFIEWYNGLSGGTILLRDIIRIDETYNSELEEIIKNNDQQLENQITSEEDVTAIINAQVDASAEATEETLFEDEELEDIDESVVSFVSMERILMPKMLDLFQRIAHICQKILDKSEKKTHEQAKTDKEINKLKVEFEKLTLEVSFNDALIKALVEQLYEAQ